MSQAPFPKLSRSQGCEARRRVVARSIGIVQRRMQNQDIQEFLGVVRRVPTFRRVSGEFQPFSESWARCQGFGCSSDVIQSPHVAPNLTQGPSQMSSDTTQCIALSELHVCLSAARRRAWCGPSQRAQHSMLCQSLVRTANRLAPHGANSGTVSSGSSTSSSLVSRLPGPVLPLPLLNFAILSSFCHG